MKKKIYFCDICGQQFKTHQNDFDFIKRYTGLEIHLKYDDEVDRKKRVKLHICPCCLHQIIRNSRKGEIILE